MVRRAAAFFGTLWRFIEGLHTAVWLHEEAVGQASSIVTALITAAVAISPGVPSWVRVAVSVVAVGAVMFFATMIRQRIGFIALREAATIAFEQTRGNIWRAAAERFSRNAEERRAYFATTITMPQRGIQIYGKRPPSRELEPIDPVEFNRGTARDSSTLVRWGKDEPEYIDLALKRKDFRRVLKELVAEEGG